MLTENGTANTTAPTGDGNNTPLGTGWTITSIAIGIFAALIAAGGMILSFRAVSAEMIPAFGAHWAWLVPIVVDLTVLVFSGVDLVLTRHGITHPIPRVTVYAATFGTIWLNYGAGGNLVGRIAHILMPSIWVMFVETMRHVVRHKANLVGVSLRQPIPAARWILSPWPTAMLWRRMILWQEHSYSAALGHERERLRTIAGLREKHGRLWRFYVSPLVRLELTLGPGQTVQPTAGAPSTDTVQGSAVDARPPASAPSTDTTIQRPPAPSTDRPRRPSTPRPRPSTAAPSTGQPDKDVWVEIGHPVYLAVRARVGKRPPEGEFHAALIEECARLIVQGELPACYADPSLTTAKRVRKDVETRFPELSPLHLIREAS